MSHTLTLSGKSATLSIYGTKGNASIVLNSKTVESGVPSFAVVDPNSGKLTTFFGLYYAEKLLDAMGIHNTWNGTVHEWLMSVQSGSSGQTTTNATGGLTFTSGPSSTGSSKGAGTTGISNPTIG